MYRTLVVECYRKETADRKDKAGSDARKKLNQKYGPVRYYRGGDIFGDQIRTYKVIKGLVNRVEYIDQNGRTTKIYNPSNLLILELKAKHKAGLAKYILNVPGVNSYLGVQSYSMTEDGSKISFVDGEGKTGVILFPKSAEVNDRP